MAQQFSEFLAELNARVRLEDVVGEYVQLKLGAQLLYPVRRAVPHDPV